ncbi:MAG: bifunctional nuclease family protein [Elusimicrobia bacterium]|nr:bifunctional nuclease family protein [Elusimicrobiota bacterium]
MITCKVEAVTFDEISQMGIVLLTEQEGKRVLPVWVGIFEAQPNIVPAAKRLLPAAPYA